MPTKPDDYKDTDPYFSTENGQIMGESYVNFCRRRCDLLESRLRRIIKMTETFHAKDAIELIIDIGLIARKMD